jgi:hypothetical protein
MPSFLYRRMQMAGCVVAATLLFALALISVASGDAAFFRDCVARGTPEQLCEKAIAG